jgi:PAS domain S-box-containing protein
MMLCNFIFKYGNIFNHPIALVNIDLPDQPLIYINQAFMNLTEYSKSEILGRNCRFLQGPETDREATYIIRKAINNHMPVCQDLLNYKKGGTTFYNRLTLTHFEDFNVNYYLGLQHEIPKKIAKNHLEAPSLNLTIELQAPVIAMKDYAYKSNLIGKEINNEEIKKKFSDSLVRIEHTILEL